MADKVSVFIDGGYLFHVFVDYRNLGLRYSFKRLIKRLTEESIPIKVHYFDSINNRDKEIKEKQENFFYGLLRDKFGWDVNILPLQWPDGENAKQKGTDSSIALKLHQTAIEGEYDVAILIAADSDFVPAVNLVIKSGKVVRNAYFSKGASYHLQQACNGKLIRLDEIDFIYRKDNPRDLFTLDSTQD